MTQLPDLDFIAQAPLIRFDESDIIGIPEPEGEYAPPPPEMPFQTVEHTWIGTDGTEWDLTNPDSGAFLVQEGIEGLHVPPMDLVRRESPMLAGASYHGYRVKPRPVVWPLYIYSDESSMHWVERDRALWKALRPGSEGIWRVTLPNGDMRQLRMRIDPTPMAMDRDPVRFGWQKYAVQATADINPFWTTPTEVAGSRISWRVSDDPDEHFFGGAAGVAPPFVIAESAIETTQRFTNTGDEPVWPVITVTGPMTTVDVTIGVESFTIDSKLTSGGQWLKIVTDPRFFAVTDNQGRNRIRDVSTWTFQPLPVEEEIALSVTPNGDGGGSVVFDVTPLFHRAW